MYELSYYDNGFFKQNIQDIGIKFPSKHKLIGTVCSEIDCLVTHILVEDGELVYKGTPLLVLDAEPPWTVSPFFPMPEQMKIEIKRIIMGRIGIGITLRDFVATHKVAGVPLPILASLDVPKRCQNLKRFDTSRDHSDHLFLRDFDGWKQGLSPALSNLRGAPDLCNPPEDWANTIREEWRILDEHLPEMIYVRAFEARMDILRAVIFGQKGTPYHDGLFFFDVRFPSSYPQSPPLVRYISGVPGYNPPLDKSSEVGWYLLNIKGGWWVPGTSNILQLLVSIQGLIMNSKPFFNGFGNSKLMGDVVGDRFSLLYNETTFINSLKTMVYIMNKPPRSFGLFVVNHFRKHALEILKACRAYIEGLQDGCLVDGTNHTCSSGFKKDVASCIKPLQLAFNKILVKDQACLSEMEYLLQVAQSIKNQKQSRADIAASFGRRLFEIAAPIDCVVSEIMVSAGDDVEDGDPLYVLGKGKTKEFRVVKPRAKGPRTQKSVITSILEENRIAHVGIFSTEGRFSIQKVGVGARNDLLVAVDVKKAQKRFDHVEDDSDHYFLAESYEVEKRSEEWVKIIHEEWKILDEKLPETIKVKVYKSRMDLLRAVIIGKEGTPYQDGLFFFDVCFPSNYPNIPPLVHFHSGGLSISPKLKDGKVELSVPKTSDGRDTMWVPGTSNVLQLLVSIQDHHLNKQPLFTEPIYAYMKETVYGKVSSELYNELTYTKTLKTMAVIMSKPPKNFVDFVALHFRDRAHGIMMACTMKLNATNSVSFFKDLSSSIDLLVLAFGEIGAEDGIQELVHAR